MLSRGRGFAIAGLLIVLMASAFVIRVDNFRKSRAYTIDEIVYYQLARGLVQTPVRYNTREYAAFLAAEQPEILPLPAYFTAPLFKHPPVFPFLVAQSLRVFGDRPLSGVYVAAGFGVLLILLGYLLGRLFFNESVGMWAAFVLWLDPVNIICSQRVWMETTLSFWMLLGLLLFGAAVKYARGNYFIYSGVAVGLAGLTKYPGLLMTLVFVLYGLVERDVCFRNRKFWLGLALPFLLLLPWFYWNGMVYGWGIFARIGMLHGLGNYWPMILAGLAGSVGVCIVWRLSDRKSVV